jgi:hypothetical protein
MRIDSAAGCGAALVFRISRRRVLATRETDQPAGCLLPSRCNAASSAPKRWAVIRAIKYVEQQGGPHAIYGMVSTVGIEGDQYVESVAVASQTIPPSRRFLSVGPNGNVEERDFKYVAAAFAAQPSF